MLHLWYEHELKPSRRNRREDPKTTRDDYRERLHTKRSGERRPSRREATHTTQAQHERRSKGILPEWRSEGRSRNREDHGQYLNRMGERYRGSGRQALLLQDLWNQSGLRVRRIRRRCSSRLGSHGSLHDARSSLNESLSRRRLESVQEVKAECSLQRRQGSGRVHDGLRNGGKRSTQDSTRRERSRSERGGI